MARRRQHQDKGDGCDLTARQRTWLLSGRDWSHIDGGAGAHGLGGFPHQRAARRAWESCREELLGFWIQEPSTWLGESSFATPAPGGPGTRPWAWWYFDALMPRVVVEQLEPARKNELCAIGWFSEKAWRDFFGCPAGAYVEAESEASYLSRHRFFLEGEATAIQGPPEPTLVE